jgi:hypothetical protein
MFNKQQLTEILELHEKSFGLLRWINSALKQNALSFSTMHETTDTARAAAEWIARHLSNIPHDVRPSENQMNKFANLFVSFLQTSFKLTQGGTASGWGLFGCFCSCCRMIRYTPYLELRNPSKKDFRDARDLKVIYLKRLAEEQKFERTTELVETILANATMRENVSLATWATELIRRSEFASQGESVLALWREFAWKDGNAKRNFKVKPTTFMEAEQSVLAQMKIERLV